MASICNIVLEFQKHIWAKNENVSFYYSNSQIDCTFSSNKKPEILSIKIDSDGDTFAVSLGIFNYLFLVLGHMPEIKKFEINSKDIKKELSPKYFYSNKFNYNDMALFNINSNTFNSRILSYINGLNKELPVLNSIIALHSKSYELISEEHRLTLLLHSIEGYYRLLEKHETLKQTIADCLSPMLNYTNKFNIPFSALYGYDMDSLFKDIRNKYSHYLDNKIVNFNDFDYLFTFFILSYALRLKISLDASIKVEENYVKEYLSSLYDWINETKGNKVEYLSVAYKMRNILNKI